MKMIGKILTLGVLYFVQGLPYGFQDKFIPMYLRSAGLSHTKLSLMKLLFVPWLCKAGFGPLIDLKWTKWLWLLLSLAVLTFISFCGVFIDTNYFVLMCVWLFLLNLFSAFQDVSVDALALHILKECEMGHGNTAQVIGYKLGALFGGGILFWINYYYGWQYLCLCLTSLYIMSIVAFLPMFIQSSSESGDSKSSIDSKYKDGDNKKNDNLSVGTEISEEVTGNIVQKMQKISQTIESEGSSVRRRHKMSAEQTSSDSQEPRSLLLRPKRYSVCEIPHLIFSTRGTIPAIVFLLFYKLGERGALSTFPIFLVDQGVPAKTIGLWNGIIGQFASLFGSVCSGWIISHKWDLKHFLSRVLLARTVPIIMLWIIVNVWFSALPSFIHSFLFYLSTVSLIALEFTAGLVTTSVFTLMMSCSLKAPESIQATHYSLLSSVEITGKLMLSSFSGALIDWFGLSRVYFMFVLLSAPPLLVLSFIEC